MDLRRFPAALYLRLFGAGGFGYLVGRVGHQAATVMLAIACCALSATLAGWLMMRPLMREAKQAMVGRRHINPLPEEEHDTDD